MDSVSNSSTITVGGLTFDTPTADYAKPIRADVGSRKETVSIDVSHYVYGEVDNSIGYESYRLTLSKGGACYIWDFCTKEPKYLTGSDSQKVKEIFSNLSIGFSKK